MRCALLALVLLATPIDAQTSARAATLLLSGPNGRELATIRAGSALRPASGAGATRQGHTQVTLDGYIDASLLGPGRDSFPNLVKAPSGARLRSAGRPDAAILADLRNEMGVNIVSRSGTWVRVRRTGWVVTSALSAPAGDAAASPGGGSPPAMGRAGATAAQTGGRGAAQPPPGARDTVVRPADAASIEPAPAGSLRPLGNVALRTAPDGRTVATLDSGAVLTPLARTDGWTRVRVEGWIRDDQVVPADTALRLSLSGADLRADPERYRGAVVRWEVEFISIQKADPLRRDLRQGEPYILARGPGAESGLLYVAIPQALLAEMERFKPLDVITITARIRVGRSEPAGVPVLDLITAARR